MMMMKRKRMILQRSGIPFAREKDDSQTPANSIIQWSQPPIDGSNDCQAPEVFRQKQKSAVGCLSLIYTKAKPYGCVDFVVLFETTSLGLTECVAKEMIEKERFFCQDKRCENLSSKVERVLVSCCDIGLVSIGSIRDGSKETQNPLSPAGPPHSESGLTKDCRHYFACRIAVRQLS